MQRNLIGQALLTAASVPLDTAKPALDEHHVPHPFLSPSASYAPQGLSETLLAADPAPQIKSDGEADTATSGSLDAANSSVQMDSVPELTVPNQSIPGRHTGSAAFLTSYLSTQLPRTIPNQCVLLF